MKKTKPYIIAFDQIAFEAHAADKSDLTDESWESLMNEMGGTVVQETDSLLAIKNHFQVSKEQWQHIVSETVKMFCFATINKDIVYPMLHESWDKEDEKELRGLKRSLKRFKELDPGLMLQIDIKSIKDKYAAMALKGIQNVQETMKEATGRVAVGNNDIQVSEL